MKNVTCPKGPKCQLFTRPIEVVSQTREIVDENLMVVEVENPREMRMTRRFTGVHCLFHGVQAHIIIGPN